MIGAALGDQLHGQTLRARARRITAQPRQPGVDHILDARQRERSLGNVGGQNHAARAARTEDALLLATGHATIERDDFRARAQPPLQQITRLADIPLRGEKHQHIPGLGFQQHILHRIRRRPQVIIFVLRRVKRRHRRIADFHRIQPARDFHDGRIVKGRRERGGINRRRGNNQLEIRALWQQPAQMPQQEIDV